MAPMAPSESHEVATRASWQCWPPGRMDAIPYRTSFSAVEYAAIRRGLVPEEMEDKWFIFWEDDVLYIHRSWTGLGVYRVMFRSRDDGYEVHEAYVSADAQHYRRGPDDYEVRLVNFLIRTLLLHEIIEFPVPVGIGRRGSRGMYRFLVAGNVLTMDGLAEPQRFLVRTWRRVRRWFRDRS